MTSAPNSRRRALTAGLASSLWLAACGGGGGGGNGSSNLRALNLTTDLPNLDLYTGDTKQFSSLALDALASSISVEANTYTLNVRNAGDATQLFSGSYSLSKDQSYTAVVWGRQSSLRVTTLPESEDPANISTASTARVRLFNATVDSGPVDVYILNPATSLDTGPLASQSNLTGGTLAGYRDFSAGTWRVLVTAPGNIGDVRLDIPALTLTDKQYVTLVFTQAGSGGVLLNGTAVVQQGARTTFKNTKARVRLAAGVSNQALLAVTFGSTTLFSNFRSPRVAGAGAYAQVDAATAALNFTVNGVTARSASQTFVAGSDYTLLAYGTDAAPQFKVITDDNRVPSANTQTKLRLINGLPGEDLLTVLVDGRALASDVPSGAASAYVTLLSSGTQRLEVSSSLAVDMLYTQAVSNIAVSLLQPATVYTVFLLGGLAAPRGYLITDR
jgi:Domain of unknown function (DUF4397)